MVKFFSNKTVRNATEAISKKIAEINLNSVISRIFFAKKDQKNPIIE